MKYFKHAAHSPFFFCIQNAIYFIRLPCLVPVLFAFYIQGVLKFKCKIPAPKGYAETQYHNKNKLTFKIWLIYLFHCDKIINISVNK